MITFIVLTAMQWPPRLYHAELPSFVAAKLVKRGLNKGCCSWQEPPHNQQSRLYQHIGSYQQNGHFLHRTTRVSFKQMWRTTIYFLKKHQQPQETRKRKVFRACRAAESMCDVTLPSCLFWFCGCARHYRHLATNLQTILFINRREYLNIALISAITNKYSNIYLQMQIIYTK